MTSDSLDQRLPAARADRVPLGILFMLAATVMFAGSSALSKWQVASYSFAEVLFFRSVVSLVVCAAADPAAHRPARVPHHRLRDHAGRSATQAVAQSLIIDRLQPDAAWPAPWRSISPRRCSPRCSPRSGSRKRSARARGGALLVGFLGVLLVASPGADSFRIGALFALANAVLYGSVTAAVRGMTATESAETLTMYQMVFLAVIFRWPPADVRLRLADRPRR